MGNIAPFADHGERYTIFDNDILDYVMPACKTGAQWKIVCAILRATRGWHKERDVLSLSQLQVRTGMTRPAVMAGIEAALKAEMITRVESGKSFSYSLNRDFTIGKESLPSDSKESLPVTSKESLHTKEISKEKKEKKARTARATLGTPPLIEALRQGTGRYPKKQTWDKLIEDMAGLDPEHVKATAITWVSRGFRETNFDGIIKVARFGWETRESAQTKTAPRATSGSGLTPEQIEEVRARVMGKVVING